MNDLTARIDEQLKATEGHTAGPWHVSDRVGEQVIVRTSGGQGVATSLNRDEDHPDAALIASAPTLRALLVEARAQIAAQAEALAGVEKVRDELRGDTRIHRTAAAGSLDAGLWALNARYSAFAEVTHETACRLTTALLGARQ